MCSHNYWVVGANWSGDDKTDVFFNRGYWQLGWSDCEQPRYAELRSGIRPGDRIAIKSMRGRAAPTITIKALGIVKEIDPEDKRIYVNWLLKLDREVQSRGCFGALHGPFTQSDDREWINDVFRI